MGTIFRGSADAEDARRDAERRLADDQAARTEPVALAASEIRRMCLRLGADDVGFVEVERPALGEQSAVAERLLPGARTLLSLVVATNRDNLVSPPRSVANNSFHHDGERLTTIAHDIGRALRRLGTRAVVSSVGFPMEADRFGTSPEPIWEIAHKTVAVEAGLGHMGIHRNVIHPRFGNFVLLDTLVVDAAVDVHDTPLDYNPCADCNLCIAACPVGAISRTDDFDFFACLNHNYREFLGGFGDWAESLAAASSADEYHTKFRDHESVSLWQSLGFGPQYKSAYCMAVCPAGEDVIGPYLSDRRSYVETYVRPLRERPEPVYVQSGTHAERAALRNPAKEVRYVDYKVGVAGVDNAIRGLQHMFDGSRGAAEGLTVRCLVDPAADDPGSDGPKPHELVLAVKRAALQRLDPGADQPEPTATARGPLAAWMTLLQHAAAGHPTIPDELTVSGDTAAFETLLASLH